MALHYQLVFAMLVAEIVAVTVLTLPMPARARRVMLQLLSSSSDLPQVRYGLGISCLAVLVLFADAANTVYKLNTGRSIDSPDGAVAAAATAGARVLHARMDPYLHAKMFYAQRNLYLTGAVLFLAAVLGRFRHLMSSLLRSEEALEALQRESERTREMFKRRLEEAANPRQAAAVAAAVPLPESPLVDTAEASEANASLGAAAASALAADAKASFEFAAQQVDRVNKAFHKLVERVHDPDVVTAGDSGSGSGAGTGSSGDKKLV